MAYRIDKQFFQHQVQFKLDLLAERVGRAKTTDLRGQSFEFFKVPVEQEIGFVKNFPIVPHARQRFQYAASEIQAHANEIPAFSY